MTFNFSQNSISAISNGSYIFDSAQRAVMTADSSFLYPGSINFASWPYIIINSYTSLLGICVGFYPVSRIFQECSPEIWWKQLLYYDIYSMKFRKYTKIIPVHAAVESIKTLPNVFDERWWTSMRKPHCVTEHVKIIIANALCQRRTRS